MGLVNYASLSTERQLAASRHLDRLNSSQIVRLMNREDRQVLRAIDQAAPAIAAAITIIVNQLRKGGRLVFVGAGTSGRLGIIEAAECPPTFNTPPSLIQAVMAGGTSAVFKSKEGSEDSEVDARNAIHRLQVGPLDVVVGIAASGVTPFVCTALRQARKRKAKSVLLTCNPKPPRLAHHTIILRTGAEVLSGSTRLKAGSACKMVLNILTTGSMVRLGKVYGNQMVDLQPKSRKLVERGVRLIQQIGHVSEPAARRLFQQAHGRVKVAIVMARQGCGEKEAKERLKSVDGFLKGLL